MNILLSIHNTVVIRGDGLLPALVALLERPIPKVGEPVDALPESDAPLQQNGVNLRAGRL